MPSWRTACPPTCARPSASSTRTTWTCARSASRPEGRRQRHRGRPRAVETGHDRSLATVFGEVRVRRIAYRHRGEDNLCPADAASPCPKSSTPTACGRFAAEESSRGSFDETVAAAIGRASGQHVPKRQVEELTRRSRGGLRGLLRTRQAGRSGRPRRGRDLRRRQGHRYAPSMPCARSTAKAAAPRSSATPLSKPESPYKNAWLSSALSTTSPRPRCPEDMMGHCQGAAPVARAKWLTASVTDDIAEVIKTLFDETDRRDPGHRRTWVALVDGARHQISCIKAEAKARDVNVTIVVDFIHVLEYIWGRRVASSPVTAPALRPG